MTNIGYAALLAFVFSIPWENVILIPEVGTASRLVGMLAFPFWLIAVVMNGRVFLPWPIVLLAAFVALAALSVNWTHDVTGGVVNTQTYVQLLLMTWLATQLIDSEGKLHGVFMAYILGGYVAAMGSIHTYMTGAAYTRFTPEGMDPNDTALRISVAIAMAGYLAVCRRGWWRLVTIGFIALAIYAVLLSASRTGFLAMLIAASLPVLLLLRPRHFGKALVLGLAGVTVVWVLLVNYVPERSLDRIADIGTEITEGDLSGRYDIWAVGLDMINEAPLFGVGVSAYDKVMERMAGRERGAHNTFLAIAAEQGIVGLLLVLAAWGLVIRDILSMPKRERLTWLMFLVVLMTALMTLSWETRKVAWLLFALALVHARYARPPAPLAEVARPDLTAVAAGRPVRAFHRS